MFFKNPSERNCSINITWCHPLNFAFREIYPLSFFFFLCSFFYIYMAAFTGPTRSRSICLFVLTCWRLLLCRVGGPCVEVCCRWPTDVSNVVYLARLPRTEPLMLWVSLTRGGGGNVKGRLANCPKKKKKKKAYSLNGSFDRYVLHKIHNP